MERVIYRESLCQTRFFGSANENPYAKLVFAAGHPGGTNCITVNWEKMQAVTGGEDGQAGAARLCTALGWTGLHRPAAQKTSLA